MKTLLISTAVIEASAGLALLISPSGACSLVFGSAPGPSAGLTISRIAGAGLLSLGLACWQARLDVGSRAGAGLIAALLLYNVAAVAILAHAGLGAGPSGVGLWSGVILHAAMGAWCVASLRVTTGLRN